MIKEKGYALVTGATGGLGRAFAFELASRGYALLLTGRSEDKLTALKTEITRTVPSARVYTYSADLSSETDRARIFSKIAGEGRKISLRS